VKALSPRYRPTRELRIAQIVARLNVGGPAMHTVMLANHFNRNNYRSLLITGRPLENEGDMTYLLDEMPADVEHVASLSRDISPVKDLRSLSALASILARFRPHIVHTHTAKAGFLGRAAAVLLNVGNIVHTFHGHTFAHYFGAVKNHVFMSFERMLAHRTSKIIAVSRRQVRDLARVYRIAPAPKVVEVPYGMDLTELLECEVRRDVLRGKLGLRPGTPVVGIVGRLYTIKAHDFFVLSALRLLKKRSDVHFIVVGDGDERAGLERMVRAENASSNIHFLGWQKDMAAAYAAMDILALTSLNEGSPVSLIEGMAAGLPAVSTPAGGVPDLFIEQRKDGDLRVARNGILVDRRDPELFAEALRRLVDDAETRRRMGREARRFAGAKFSRERLLADMEDLYLGLVRWAAGTRA
jgi:glycosyltransferase involved in cell wall biosynthesis